MKRHISQIIVHFDGGKVTLYLYYWCVQCIHSAEAGTSSTVLSREGAVFFLLDLIVGDLEYLFTFAFCSKYLMLLSFYQFLMGDIRELLVYLRKFLHRNIFFYIVNNQLNTCFIMISLFFSLFPHCFVPSNIGCHDEKDVLDQLLQVGTI